MELFNLYAGLGGGFGGANFQLSDEFDSLFEAEEEARRLAIEEYESYEGTHGILSEADVRESYCDDNEISEDELSDEDEATIADLYIEEIEGWITYHAVLASEDLDHEEED